MADADWDKYDGLFHCPDTVTDEDLRTGYEAFYATSFPTARLTSLRRDEERSFKTAPFARAGVTHR